MAERSQNGIPTDLESAGAESLPAERDGSEYLRLLGDSVRAARARRGMTRKMLAKDSGVSERFLAQLESGTGNASILVLRQISAALNLPLDAMLPGADPPGQELEAALELLRGLDPAKLTKAHELLRGEFSPLVSRRNERIALIGLRGAGKSTIGKLLGEHLELAFFELDRLIEHESGLSLSMIFDMYGQSGFRRFERRCLEDLLKREDRFVLATGGSLVSEPATYDRLLATCYTIWLKATPQEHMSRVIEQGDMRPMARNPQAMSDLERILAERNLLYGKADATVSTSNRTVQQVIESCVESVKSVIDSPVTGSMRQ
jgi:XRE family transcriptional regulator, aerobic/anaerobic benzoate catabolism transcriptional regulator